MCCFENLSCNLCIGIVQVHIVKAVVLVAVNNNNTKASFVPKSPETRVQRRIKTKGLGISK